MFFAAFPPPPPPLAIVIREPETPVIFVFTFPSLVIINLMVTCVFLFFFKPHYTVSMSTSFIFLTSLM